MSKISEHSADIIRLSDRRITPPARADFSLVAAVTALPIFQLSLWQMFCAVSLRSFQVMATHAQETAFPSRRFTITLSDIEEIAGKPGLSADLRVPGMKIAARYVTGEDAASLLDPRRVFQWNVSEKGDRIDLFHGTPDGKHGRYLQLALEQDDRFLIQDYFDMKDGQRDRAAVLEVYDIENFLFQLVPAINRQNNQKTHPGHHLRLVNGLA